MRIRPLTDIGLRHWITMCSFLINREILLARLLHTEETRCEEEGWK
jgi:hypothetical protein